MLKLKNHALKLSAVLSVGLLTSSSAMAKGVIFKTKDSLEDITANFIDSTLNLPGLISIVAYMAGLALGVLGVLKLKDHVENPSQTPLKDGAVRLGAGGALLALPFLYEVLVGSMTANDGGVASQVVRLQGLSTTRTVQK